MKNKRGFTLIELLAVIVILAIIALIATPIVLNMINSARKSAARSSALGYVDSIEYYLGFHAISEDVELTGYSVPLPEMTNGKVTCTKTSSGWNSECSAFFSAVDEKAKGDKPKTATIVLSSTGKVSNGTTMKFGKYDVNYDGKDATVVGESGGSSNFGGTYVAPTNGQTHKGIVYMNPTDLTVECTESNSQIGTGSANASGCMKFYIFDNSGDTYKMILDHNTTATVAYETSGTYKEYSEASIKTTVDNDTTGWVGSPRIITANEIAAITNTSIFDGSPSKWFYFNGTGDNKQTSSQGDNEYAWLFDYTKKCTSYGCDTADSSTYGYWTSSPVSIFSDLAWFVNNDGSLRDYYVDSDGNYGVRPVITISKSQIQ